MSIFMYRVQLSCVCTLRLIGPISYPDECDLMVHPQKYSGIFSRMHFVTFVYIYNIHEDTKTAQLIAMCKRTLRRSQNPFCNTWVVFIP